VAEYILVGVGLYAASGVVFGVLFVVVFARGGIGRLDPVAQNAPWTVRVLILPGMITLWPLMLLMWLRAGHTITLRPIASDGSRDRGGR
jgi:hypothetical protein